MAMLHYDVRTKRGLRREEEVDPDIDDLIELLDEMDEGFDSFDYRLDIRSGIDVSGSIELGFTVHVSEGAGLWRVTERFANRSHPPVGGTLFPQRNQRSKVRG